MTPKDRVTRAKIAAHTRWGKQDGREGTAKARRAFADRFLQEADPEGVLPEEERQRRAESLKKAHFSRLALKSAQARRRRRAE